jgi:hypothetical protein
MQPEKREPRFRNALDGVGQPIADKMRGLRLRLK